MTDRYDRILSDERAAAIYSHLIGEEETQFGAYDTPENLRRLAEAAVRRVFQNEKIPHDIKKLLDQKFPTNEYPRQESTKNTGNN
jgi:hypothetical protein